MFVVKKNCRRKYFVRLIFVALCDYKNFLTTKISQFTILKYVNICSLQTSYGIPSSGVVAVTVVLNGPSPTLVCAAMLQVYETNGLSDSKRNNVPEETICVILIPSSDVMLMV